jgi:hypothetical protein
MAGQLQWYGDSYSCPEDPSKNHEKGWYYGGEYTGISDYRNPKTGKAYDINYFAGNNEGASTDSNFGSVSNNGENFPSMENQPGVSETIGAPGTTATKVGVPKVDAAPAYEPSPEELAWQETYGGKLEDWVQSGGYGIPEETQELMGEQLTDTLKANETEQIRVMKNEMERRGITNSGLLFSETQKIKANTTQQIAKGITDIKIQSALMKMASFEQAMGQAGQYLNYLSNQTQLKYAPEFATWQAKQEAKLMAWQENMDRQKLAIEQAYQQQNMQLEYELTSQLNKQQFQYEKELTQMEIEANEKAAMWGGIGQLFGFLFGFLLL